jgi:hypothetical protein
MYPHIQRSLLSPKEPIFKWYNEFANIVKTLNLVLTLNFRKTHLGLVSNPILRYVYYITKSKSIYKIIFRKFGFLPLESMCDWNSKILINLQKKLQ